MATPPKPVAPEWATQIYWRRPEFKIHRTLGHAKNAMTYHHVGPAALWRWDQASAEWVLVWECERGVSARDAPWIKDKDWKP